MSTATINPKDLDPVVCALIEGLIAPERYKQHHLEAALRALVMDDWVDEARKEFQWETGPDPM